MSRRIGYPFLPSYSAYREPAVKFAGEQAVPESRAEIKAKWEARLATEIVFRQNYSNGEFTSNSLVLSRELAPVLSRELDLDGASSEAYLDPELKIYWRRSGCFD